MHFKNILLLTSLSFVLIACGSNPPPSLASIADQTTNQSTAKAVALVVNTYNAGGTLTYSATSDNADVVISVSGSTLTLTPIPTWNGSATITAKVNDGFYDSAAQTFTLTVNPLSSFELLDPTFAAGNSFGDEMTVLTNGNIVVASPYDSRGPGGANSGAVHLYNPYAQTVIKSFYGDQEDDKLGISGVTALGNNNFVIASPYDKVDGNEDAGSVMLVNGATGLQIGVTLVGDQKDDELGNGGVTALGNNNFVIASPLDDDKVDGKDDAGSVMLVSGTTGLQIGVTLVGDQEDDYLGRYGVTALDNNNFVVISPFDTDKVGGNKEAGSVMLVSGATGALIKTLVGDQADDYLGSSGVTALGNNNFVIASPSDNDSVGSNENAGSVMLVNGATGALIKTLVGDQKDDYLGNRGVTALANNNFVVISSEDQVDSIPGAGSVKLVSGTTGAQIGDNILQGTTKDDMKFPRIITTTAPDAFIIGFPYFDKSEQVDSGFAKVFAY